MSIGRILVLGPEVGRELAQLETAGYEVTLVEDLVEAEQRFGLDRPDAVVLDEAMGPKAALAFIQRLKDLDATVPILVLLDPGKYEWAAEAIRVGAEQILAKPVDSKVLLTLFERLFERIRERKRNLAEESRKVRFGVSPFFGTSAAVSRLEDQVKRVLDLDRPVLIQGETGVGKSALARWIHSHGPRKGEAFVELNCAGLAKDLLETELFGHEKGAFTGAVASKLGLMEIAHRGTLFLDEIGDMDLAVQPKVLKAVEERQYRRLGDTKDRVVDIRLIGATHRDLQRLVGEGKFRSDLYYRVAGLPVVVPPLRERHEDIVPLARFFLERFAQEWRCGGLALAPESEDLLAEHRWPGNIRELKNALERAIIHRQGSILKPEDFQLGRAEDLPSGEVQALSLSLEEVEKRHIQRVLASLGGRVDQAARSLGISRSSLYQRIQRFGLKVDPS
ncbi:MAG TPA: sigma-54 dependent transcriptional regulator [Holophagaceae bacterium]|nr:sigma-54 dependent transcriptional regulator [Holophagaceae bacterium]